MNIYSYYEETGHPHQEAMLKIWTDNWKSKGYNPIVLGIDHVKAHNYYDEYITKCESLHRELTSQTISPISRSQFLKWLAYATTSDDKMFVSDYDVINNDFHQHTIIDKIHIFGTRVTTCFASGSSSQFELLARLLVELTEKNIHNNTYIKSGPRHVWHDQMAVRDNIHDFSEDFIQFSDTIDSWYHEDWRKQPLIHVSHFFTKTYMQHHKIPEMSIEDRIKTRVQLMKEISNE